MNDPNLSDFYFRHDKIRQHQSELIKDIYAAVSSRKHIVAHAPVGMGKTDAALGATLSYAIQNDLTVFFLTPKISQHRIAIDVVRDIAKKHAIKIRGVDMVGRRYMCIDPTLTDLDHDGFYQSCEKKRKREECGYYGKSRGYSKIEETKAGKLFNKFIEEYGAAKTHQEVYKQGETSAACPYEWLIKLAAFSNVIVADYFHLMIPGIREIFLIKTKKQLEKSIIIIDEAHNLAKRVRDQMSATITSGIVERAEKEMKIIGAEKLMLSHFFSEWGEDNLENKKEKLISTETLGTFIEKLQMPVDEFSGYMEYLGMEFIEKTNKKSACLRLAKFMKKWHEKDAGSIRIIKGRNGRYVLSKKFLDPSSVTEILNSAHSAILMSGTLLPLEMHRDVLGLDKNRTEMRKYPSPFEEGRMINIITQGVTTKYSKRDFQSYSEMAEKIDKIIEVSPQGIALFFPSYNVMNSVVPLMKKRSMIVQKEKMTPKDIAETLRRFSAGEGMLCAVQGGSLSEGVDYSNSEIKTAIIIGVALEEMSLEIEALIEHYQEKFGKGWEYGYLYPGVIKALQAAGRCIRKESDRAAIVYMDERFQWKNYSRAFDGKRFIITNEPERYVQEFWGR